MSKHTPESWEAHGAHIYAGKNCIGICDTDNDNEGAYEANARLMAAAPDLLSALQDVLAEWREGYGLHCINEVRAAISRATGEQP